MLPENSDMAEAIEIIKRLLVWADEPEAGDDHTYRTHRADREAAERFLLDRGETLP